jgi:hypothetical protein
MTTFQALWEAGELLDQDGRPTFSAQIRLLLRAGPINLRSIPPLLLRTGSL